MIIKYKGVDNISKKSNKIPLDKYYTSPQLAKYIVDKTKEIIGEGNISEYIEPSAGLGVFLDYLDKPYLAYDIEPEHKQIIKQDYLELDLPYKKDRLIIGNPPYGTRNTLSVRFFKKSIQIADYIAFILPISQHNNNQQMYEFDLLYSEDLGLQMYSDRELHCCFNIYKRPDDGNYNEKPNYKLKDIDIIEYRRGGNTTIPEGYDFAMGTFGAGCVGKIPQEIGKYALECYFYINNKTLKNKVLEVLSNYDWKSVSKGISNTYRLPQWKIYKILKEELPELE